MSTPMPPARPRSRPTPRPPTSWTNPLPTAADGARAGRDAAVEPFGGAAAGEQPRGLHRLAGHASRAALQDVRRTVAVVLLGARALLGKPVPVLRHPTAPALPQRAAQPEDAWGGVVRRIRAELRRARLPQRDAGPAGAHLQIRDAPDDGNQLGHPPRPDGAYGRGAQALRHQAGRPRRRLHAEYPRNRRGVPGHRQPGWRVLELLA